MEVTWLGDGCFRLRSRDVTIVLDPPAAGGGAPRGLADASIVVLSDGQAASSRGTSAGARVIQGPGEYEIGGVLITGVSTSVSGGRAGEGPQRKVAYMIEMDEVRLCHLGPLEQVLSPEQVEELNRAEVLIVPVGGHGVLDAAAAAEVVSLLEPRIVVPMLYRTELANADLDPLERFLKEMGVSEVQPVPRLNVTKTSLPVETAVTVLDYRR